MQVFAIDLEQGWDHLCPSLPSHAYAAYNDEYTDGLAGTYGDVES
jgi:hypothetical protein